MLRILVEDGVELLCLAAFLSAVATLAQPGFAGWLG